jgi:DnaJ like chaperone protein
MGWIGKVVGGIAGLAAGPLGAALGVLIGHSYDVAADQRANQTPNGDFQGFFFDTAFAVMGFVAKSDGRVSESEIAAARSIMQGFHFDEAHVVRAISAFNRGKQPNYPVDSEIVRLVRVCAPRPDLLALFLEIQMRAVLAGEGLDGGRRRLIVEIGRRMGFSDAQIEGLEALLLQQTGSRAGSAAPSRTMGIQQAYGVLGISASASDADVKKAYRRLMSENHPDKLVARGLPESMQDLAKEKTQRIREAYDVIAEHRGIR